MKDKQQCKEEIAKENNFDSFDRAIRYTFNRPLLQSEYEFINKIIDEAMDRYAQQQVKNLNIPVVTNRYYFDCWKRDGKRRSRVILATSVDDAIVIFKSKYPDMNFDRPFV